MPAPSPHNLSYQPPSPARPRRAWHTLALSLAGLLLGLAAGVALVLLVGFLTPIPSRTTTSTQSACLYFAGLAAALPSLPLALSRRWFLASLLAGTGASLAFLGLAIGALSSMVA